MKRILLMLTGTMSLCCFCQASHADVVPVPKDRSNDFNLQKDFKWISERIEESLKETDCAESLRMSLEEKVGLDLSRAKDIKLSGEGAVEAYLKESPKFFGNAVDPNLQENFRLNVSDRDLETPDVRKLLDSAFKVKKNLIILLNASDNKKIADDLLEVIKQYWPKFIAIDLSGTSVGNDFARGLLELAKTGIKVMDEQKVPAQAPLQEVAPQAVPSDAGAAHLKIINLKDTNVTEEVAKELETSLSSAGVKVLYGKSYGRNEDNQPAPFAAQAPVTPAPAADANVLPAPAAAQAPVTPATAADANVLPAPVAAQAPVTPAPAAAANEKATNSIDMALVSLNNIAKTMPINS